MNQYKRRDLRHIDFEGRTRIRPPRVRALANCRPDLPAESHALDDRLDDFIAWVLDRGGLDSAAYRPQPLHRRVPACLRALKVGSTDAARALLGREPHLITMAVSSLLIGVTEFFREPSVFEFLRARVMPALAGRNTRLRIWSAGCSTGAELYSMAILLSEFNLLARSHLLGTDCRGDVIERAKLGQYDAAAMNFVSGVMLDKYFETIGQLWRPIETLRRYVRWKVADLLADVEDGPWDIILWRNTAIYFNSSPAEAIWYRLVSVLTPQGLLVTGKADRPPHDAGLTQTARCIYRSTNGRTHRPEGTKDNRSFHVGKKPTLRKFL